MSPVDKAANPVRGEVALELGEQKLCLRPTFARLIAAEEELGSLFALVERAAGGNIRLEDMAGLFWHCLEEASDTRQAFCDQLIAQGIGRLLPTYRRLLSCALGG